MDGGVYASALGGTASGSSYLLSGTADPAKDRQEAVGESV